MLREMKNVAELGAPHPYFRCLPDDVQPSLTKQSFSVTAVAIWAVGRVKPHAAGKTANPAGADFPHVAFDDRTGIEEIGGGHVNAVRG
jgi:hypothetical protein